MEDDRQNELERFQSEFEELTSKLNEFSSTCRKLIRRFWEEKEYQRYVDCSEPPTLVDLPSINTLITSIEHEEDQTSLCELINIFIQILDDIKEYEIDLGNMTESENTDKCREIRDLASDAIEILLKKYTEKFLSKTESLDAGGVHHTQKQRISIYHAIHSENSKKSRELQFGAISIELPKNLSGKQFCMRIVHSECLGCDPQIDDHIRQMQPEMVFTEPPLPIAKPPPQVKIVHEQKKLKHGKKKVVSTKKTKTKQQQELLPTASDEVGQSESDRLKAQLLSRVTAFMPKSSAKHSSRHRRRASVQYGANMPPEFSLFGGVWRVEAFHLSPKPVIVGPWTIKTEVNHNELQLVEFPAVGDNAETEFIAVSLRISKEKQFVGLIGDQTVAYWDKSYGQWKRGIYTTHVEKNKQDDSLCFHLSKFGQVAAFQQSDFHFPYKFWSMKPSSSETVQFVLKTACASLTFEINDFVIRLSLDSGAELSRLKDINLKWFSLQKMVQLLIRRGVYIFSCMDLDTIENMVEMKGVCVVAKNSKRSFWLQDSADGSEMLMLSESHLTMMHCLIDSRHLQIRSVAEALMTVKPGLSATVYRWLMLVRPLSLCK